jgi:hypothetical protein
MSIPITFARFHSMIQVVFQDVRYIRFPWKWYELEEDVVSTKCYGKEKIVF